MNNIKVIAVDIDGTLTNSEKNITKKTKDALIKAQNSGIILILASGRPTTGLYRYAEELEMDKHHGLLVSYNGSKVVDYTSKEVLFNQPLSVKEIKSILKHIKKFDITPMIDDGKYNYVENPNGFNVDFETNAGNFILKKVDDLEAFITFEANKILTSGDPEYLNQIFDEIKNPFKDTLSCMFTAPFYVEYTAKGIDKAKALDAALTPLGYKKNEIIAFGDAQNDAAMLSFAGVGVAMGNAVDELKEIADFVTLSNEEDGIAYALSNYIK